MKAKIVQKSNSYKPEDMMVAHKAIKAKWGLLRKDLQVGKYSFDDESEATKSKFLIDLQYKCNIIREKIFEAPRRESGN